MTKYTKRILISVSIFIIGSFTFVFYGLYLMDIEDRYGDLQQLYFDSKSGDIIVNNMNVSMNGTTLKINIFSIQIFIEQNTREII
jgi:hypothetical protein